MGSKFDRIVQSLYNDTMASRRHWVEVRNRASICAKLNIMSARLDGEWQLDVAREKLARLDRGLRVTPVNNFDNDESDDKSVNVTHASVRASVGR